MRIRDVEVPEPLIDAHRRGDLVLFVGAGASIAPPSGLPDFRQLTADITAECNVSLTDAQRGKADDVLLGDFKDQDGVDVHRLVAARVGTPTSRPNMLHEALVALATAAPALRVVTTNYDRHLSSVLAAQGKLVKEYSAPALPMGDDFEGLVYLHGTLPDQALVVTDRDFGRAYLTDAWAARFLERMFGKYLVLFVGYSHNDVVMSYLARGLRPGSARFALIKESDGSNWRRLGISPVRYPSTGECHDALVEAISGWASWVSMGPLGHRQRVKELVEAAPSPVPEEESYLKTVISDDEKVGFFDEFARGAEWLSWAAKQLDFQSLFDPTGPATGYTQTLAHWFAQHYVMDEDLTEAALAVVGAAGGRLGPAVWSAIGHRLHLLDNPRSPWLAPWLVLLVQNMSDLRSDWLDLALAASRWPEDRARPCSCSTTSPSRGPCSNQTSALAARRASGSTCVALFTRSERPGRSSSCQTWPRPRPRR